MKQSELNTTDILHEIVDRLRFITQRVITLENALGVGYIGETGSYNDYVSSIVSDKTDEVVTPAASEETAPPAEYEETP